MKKFDRKCNARKISYWKINDPKAWFSLTFRTLLFLSEQYWPDTHAHALYTSHMCSSFFLFKRAYFYVHALLRLTDQRKQSLNTLILYYIRWNLSLYKEQWIEHAIQNEMQKTIGQFGICLLYTDHEQLMYMRHSVQYPYLYKL